MKKILKPLTDRAAGGGHVSYHQLLRQFENAMTYAYVDEAALGPVLPADLRKCMNQYPEVSVSDMNGDPLEVTEAGELRYSDSPEKPLPRVFSSISLEFDPASHGNPLPKEE